MKLLNQRYHFRYKQKLTWLLLICFLSSLVINQTFSQAFRSQAVSPASQKSDAVFYPASYLQELGFRVEQVLDIGKLKLLAEKNELSAPLRVEFIYGISSLLFQDHMYSLSAMPIPSLGGLALSEEDGKLFRQLLSFYENKLKGKKVKRKTENLAEARPRDEKKHFEATSLPRENAPPALTSASGLELKQRSFAADRKNDNKLLEVEKAEEALKADSADDDPHRLHVLIVDPGHGGRDPGAVFFAYKEKDLVLDFAKQFRKLVQKKLPNIKVILTRTKDEYVSLAQRCRRAHSTVEEGENALFLSMHLNAWPSPYVRGFELYYLQIDAELSEQRVHYHLENFDFLNTEDTAVQKIFSYFTTSQFQWESRFFADSLLRSVQKANPDYAFNGQHAKSDNFYVLRGVIMPALLVELGFLSNEEDLKFLFNREKTDRLFSSMVEAIETYDRTLRETKNFSLKIF